MRDQRADALAQILVRYSTKVQKGDVCVIQSTDRGRAARAGDLRGGAARRRPADHAAAHERGAAAFYELASDEQLDWVPPTAEWAVENADVRIAVMATPTRASSRTVDPKKQARPQKARKPLMETSMRRAAEGGYRWSLTLFPTHAYASEAGMSLAAYEDFYYAACLATDADPVTAWQRQSDEVKRLAEWMQGKEEVHIQARGTDITLGVAGRNFIPCVGEHNMPDGEFFTGPVEDSVNGEIVVLVPGHLRRPRGVRRAHALRGRQGRGRLGRARRGVPHRDARHRRRARAGWASSASARTTASPPAPRRSCSTRRSAAPSTWRSA